MESTKREDILKRIHAWENLPALSPLAVQLIELAADDEASATDLASIIEKDPGLTTRLLKTVGSVVYRSVEPATSVRQAVVRLGFKSVRVMALSLSLRDTFRMGDQQGLDYEKFWKHSLYRALMAQDLARPLGAVDPNDAFVAGLISEIGLLLLYNVCPETDRSDFPGVNLPLQDVLALEEKRWGVHHREVGSRVLRQWRFPEVLVRAQLCFGPDALAIEGDPLCMAVELAGQARDAAFEHTADLHRLQQRVQEKIEIEPESLNTLLVTAFSRVEALADQLMVQADAQADILAVMEKANQALGRISRSFDSTVENLVEEIQESPSKSKATVKPDEDILKNTLDAVAHEIRNPLLAIGGFAKRLSQETGDASAVKRYAQIITDQSYRLEASLKEVMVYCEDYKPHLVKVDLIAFMERILDPLEEKLSGKNISIVRQFPPRFLALPLDSKKMFQTMTHLLELASAMAEKGGRTITVCIEVDRVGGEVFIKIADDGLPLPKEAQDALLDGKLTTKTLESFLRLSIAKKVIEAHRGGLFLSVEEGSGNAVTVRLPVL